MRSTILSLTFFIIILLAPDVKAEIGQIQILHVVKDKNVVVEGGPYIDHYWIETDGTRGVIYLTFPKLKSTYGTPRSISLIINIPDIKDSGSQDGCKIIYNGDVVGQLSKSSPNTWVEIALKI